jgi:hypothetical protein
MVEGELHVGKISIATGGSGCAPSSSSIFWCQLGLIISVCTSCLSSVTSQMLGAQKIN